MLIYRSLVKEVNTKALLSDLRCLLLDAEGAPTRERIRDLLIRFGVIEAGIADAFCPEIDSSFPLMIALRNIGLLGGKALDRIRKAENAEARRVLGQFKSEMLCLSAFSLPETIKSSVPEGYSFYGLYPEMYLESAKKFYEAIHPEKVVCIGIRSIGTSLSSAVCGALENLGCSTLSLTLRPRGHPFDRRVFLSHELERRLGDLANLPLLVVDEGPGLSGSSFCSVARKAAEVGFDEEKIFLFPSWEPDGSAFVSETSRRSWPRYTKFSTGFSHIRDELTPFSRCASRSGFSDVSGGKWRAVIFEDAEDHPAVQPHHEHLKYIAEQDIHGTKTAVLIKFAGLGSYGSQVCRRTEVLTEAGFHPQLIETGDGFLTMKMLTGVPLRRGEIGEVFLDHAARYFSFIENTLPSEGLQSQDELLEMIRTNIREGLGPEWEKYFEKVIESSKRVGEIRPVYLDNRVAPHEWILCAGRIFKTDSAEHFDDHFFPGPQDIAWDLSAFRIEFGLGPGAWRYLVEKFEKESGRSIRGGESFYGLAYLAFRLGYCSLAVASIGNTEDGLRFLKLREEYAALLKSELIRLPWTV